MGELIPCFAIPPVTVRPASPGPSVPVFGPLDEQVINSVAIVATVWSPNLIMLRQAGTRQLSALLGNAASDARAATAQGRWLVGVIIAARVDHNRAPFNVGHCEVRHYHGLRG